jgi:Uma2 family endonuclease
MVYFEAMDVVERERRRFTNDELIRMIEAGILTEDEPLELIDGELFMMSPQGPSHRNLTVLLHDLLSQAYAGRGHIQDHSPIALAPDSMPEPDVAVIRGAVRDYAQRLPGPDDVILVVEIAVTSLRVDRAKARVYARAGISEYWLLDVEGRRLERYARPSGDSYAVVTILAESESVSPPGVDAAWQVATFLP